MDGDGGRRSHSFPVIRDGHKPNSGALMSIIRIPVIEGGLSLSRYKELIDPGTYEDRLRIASGDLFTFYPSKSSFSHHFWGYVFLFQPSYASNLK